MFKPFPIVATQNVTSIKFVSAIGDPQPWVAIDLGSERNITSVSIAQLSVTAMKGETLSSTQ